MEYSTGLTPGKPPKLLKPQPYQGPVGGKPPPKGYTYYTQTAEFQCKTGVKDIAGGEEKFWKVTVYYTSVDDPYAPLESVTTEYVRSFEDLSKKWEHPCIYDKETRGPGYVKVERVSEQVTGEIDQEKAMSVDEENRIRALRRMQRREKEAMQAAEKAHAELIQEHRTLYKQRKPAEEAEKQKAETEHKKLIDQERERFRQAAQQQREKELQEEKDIKATAIAEEKEKVLQLDKETYEQLTGAESLEDSGIDVDVLATNYRNSASTYIKNATKPDHVVGACELLAKAQYFSDQDDQEVLQAASTKVAEFIEETIEKIIKRPDNASVEVDKQDLKELGDRIDLYQRLGDDPVIEERAMTKFWRQVQKIREKEENQANLALNGKSQINNANRGLDNPSVPQKPSRTASK